MSLWDPSGLGAHIGSERRLFDRRKPLLSSLCPWADDAHRGPPKSQLIIIQRLRLIGRRGYEALAWNIG